MKIKDKLIRYSKRIVIFCLIIVTFCSITFAANDNHDYNKAQEMANVLHDLNMFKGVEQNSDGSINYDLKRAPTRLESLVMLIRLLGKESEALSSTEECTFEDVPTWGKPYVAYAYSNGLTKGISDSEFGMGNTDVNMYLTFVLRALGYNDSPKDGSSPDFQWNDCTGMSREKGILIDLVDADNFMRADVVYISYASLIANLKSGEKTLSNKLVSDGIFTQETFDKTFNRQLLISQNTNGRVEPLRLSTGARAFSFTIVNVDKETNMTKLWLSDGSVIGSDWEHTSDGWIECTITQNALTATFSVYTDIDFENIDDLKIRYIKAGNTCTARFGCKIENNGRYWYDEDANMNGRSLMTAK